MALENAAPQVMHDRVPGRLRLRVLSIRQRHDAAARLEATLSRQADIRAVAARPRTGSVIVQFDAAVPQSEIVGAVQAAVDALGQSEVLPGDPTPCRGGHSHMEPQRDQDDWHCLDVAVVSERLGSDAATGLQAVAAAKRLIRFGPNVSPREARPSSLMLLAKQFEGLPVMMLAGSAIVSLATGGVIDAVATLSVVAVNGIIGFATEGQAERTIHALTQSADHPVRVIRDGREAAVAASALVPGDVFLVRAGQQISADARLLRARALMVDESALTGESLPLEKIPLATAERNVPLGARRSMLYSGTIVAEGDGRAMVVNTGARTEAALLQRLSATATRPPAPVEAELASLGEKLAIASLITCGAFFGIGLLRGYALTEMLEDALALAVAAVPEGLPMVATSTLSLGLRRMERKGILVRQLSAVESLGALQTICLDKTGTITENRMKVVEAVTGTRPVAMSDSASLMPLAEVAALNNDAGIVDGAISGSSQTEQAILAFAHRLGLDIAALRRARPRSRTIARAPGRPWMATFHDGERPSILIKGAPEAVLARCAHLRDSEGVRPLTVADRAQILKENDRIATRPARVLAFARGEDAHSEVRDLTFLGLLGMVDPVRPGVRDLIAGLHDAGIETVLITGDQAATAAAVAREVGISGAAPLRIIDSTELPTIEPELLAGLARHAHVFARVASHQKLAIVRALQSAGRVVAMTGDGVNDGPALAAADVGIAMGESGADLARDVANVVIRGDELGTLVEAIAQGRSIYRNIRRSLEFLVTTNMSEIGVSVIEALHGPGELETPMELLWINMVTDVLPGLGLALADPDEDVLAVPPRVADEPIIPERDLRRMGQDSAMIVASALGAHFFGLARHGPGPETRGITFLALSQAQLLYTLVCQRSDPRKLHPEALLENRTLDLALLASCGLGALPFFSPPLRRLLGIAPLGLTDIGVGFGAALVPLLTVLARRSVQISLEEIEVRP